MDMYWIELTSCALEVSAPIYTTPVNDFVTFKIHKPWPKANEICVYIDVSCICLQQTQVATKI